MWRLFLGIAFLGIGFAGHCGDPPGPSHRQDEELLVSVLNKVRGEQLDDALQGIETLVKKNPKFRLAQLVYGDLLLAKAGGINGLGNLSGGGGQADIPGLRAEARSRLHHHLGRPREGYLPAYLLKLAPGQRQVLVVDVHGSRLYLYENRNGVPHLVSDYYASSGKNGAVKQREGDRKTPVGVYFVSGHIDSGKLPDFYGAGAFPIDYPNPWDRRLGKTGSGIWLHGVPSDTYSRAPRASDGCVVLANADFSAIGPFIDVGRTPVIIAQRLDWASPQEIKRERDGVLEAVERWRSDWESRDMGRYARNYSRSFRGVGRDYREWLRYKTRVNGAKRFIRVRISELSVFADPGGRDLAAVTFLQDYASSNFRGQAKKRQYWRREHDGAWRIVYEGPA